MENRLYPNLKPIYDSDKLEFGAQTTNDLNLATCRETAGDNKLGIDENNKVFQRVGEESSTETQERPDPLTPSAPPPSENGRGLLHTLQSYLTESLRPPPYSFNDPLRDPLSETQSWHDDLTPDYDPSIDYDTEGSHDHLSDLDLSIGDISNGSAGSMGCHVQQPPQHITLPSGEDPSLVRNTNNNNNNNYNNENNNEINRGVTARDVVVVRSISSRGSSQTDGAGAVQQDNDKSNEFSAWVTWRKNVNRQLATVILLRQGGHVHIRTADLSRRPLSRSSIDYVIKHSRNDGRGCSSFSTSLSGRPYIMYGIPRVVLGRPPLQQN